MPSNAILIFLAIVPTIVLFSYIYYKDKVEKEPIGLLIGLFFLGVLTVVGAAIGESLFIEVLGFKDKLSVGENFVQYFLVVALWEEGFKFLVLRTVTWNNKNFDYTFDAIVYAVIISLGFATLENIMYVLKIGTYQVALMRALLSVPGHTIDAVFMGLFFGKAKYCQYVGDKSGKTKNMLLSFFVPMLIHGTYDFSISLLNAFEGAIVIFLGFVVVTTVLAIINVRKCSKQSTFVGRVPVPNYGFYGYYPQQTTYPQQQYQAQQYQAQQYQAQQYQTQYTQPYQQQNYYYTPNGYTQTNGYTAPNQYYRPAYQNQNYPYFRQQYQYPYQNVYQPQQQYNNYNYTGYNNPYPQQTYNNISPGQNDRQDKQ